MTAFSRDDHERLATAFEYAATIHAEQTRKGRDVPYVSHLMQVSGLVLEHGGNLEQAIAGLLHDALEDCESIERSDLAERFGETVAGIVESCSDTLDGDTPDRKSPWKLRKSQYLEHLASCDATTRLVAVCDKLHNLRNVVADVRIEGTSTFERFNTDAEGALWYYTSVSTELTHGLPPSLRHDLALAVDELRQAIQA